MTKKFFIIVTMWLFAFSANAQNQEQGKFVLHGKISGYKEGWIYLGYNTDYEVWKMDSTAVKNGEFTFEGKIPPNVYAIIYTSKRSDVIDRKKSFHFFIEPKEIHIALNNDDFENAIVTGSRTQDLLNQFAIVKESITDRRKKLSEIFDAVRKRNPGNDASEAVIDTLDEIRAKTLVERKKIRVIDLSFIKTHHNEFLSAYLLDGYANVKPAEIALTEDSLRMYYMQLSPHAQDNEFGKRIAEVLNSKSRPVLAIIGQQAPDFDLTDIDNKPIDLKMFRDKKYVLLDFWASWCGSCREMNPDLKRINSRYKTAGLEIISLSFDLDKTSWLKAIKDDDVSYWHHALVSLNKLQRDIMANYGSTSLPSYFLIDKNGSLIGRYYYQQLDNNNDNSLAAKLKEIFKN